MKRLVLILMVAHVCVYTSAQTGRLSFTIVPLGVKGGLDESNLSAYMLAPPASNRYVCLDAGTIYSGIKKAIQYKTFVKPVDTVLKHYIKAYCISHAHLDYVAGLIINSPADTTKNIYATPFCLTNIQNYYFTWHTWANFGDTGDKPTLNQYHYKALPDSNEIPVENTSMYVKAFVLSHAKSYQSTAFLVRSDSTYILYLGDTGADTTEESDKLQKLWNAVAPLVKKKQLKGIFIECSYTNSQPDNKLFGHLTPRLLMQEMNVLAGLCGREAMRNLPVVVTHIKPEANNEVVIKKQLEIANDLHLALIFPQQGKGFTL